MDGAPNIAGLVITPALLKLVSGIDEFKGAWRAIGRIAPDRRSFRIEAIQLRPTGRHLK